MTISVRTECRHTHSIVLSLGEAESWVMESRWREAKPVLVTTVQAQADPEGRITDVSLGGWYAKKDGTASKTRMAYAERTNVDALPLLVRQELVTAALQTAHGR